MPFLPPNQQRQKALKAMNCKQNTYISPQGEGPNVHVHWLCTASTLEKDGMDGDLTVTRTMPDAIAVDVASVINYATIDTK